VAVFVPKVSSHRLSASASATEFNPHHSYSIGPRSKTNILTGEQLFIVVGGSSSIGSIGSIGSRATMRAIALLLLILLPHCFLFQPQFLSEPNVANISIVILRAQLQLHPSGGQLHVTWVLTSDVTALGDGSHSIQPSLLVSCPKFHWDEFTLSGPDSSPSTHCGSMFAASLPLPAAMLAPGAHTLRLVLHEPPASSRMSCSPPFCGDSVSFHVRASSPTATSDSVLPGGAFPSGARLIFCNDRRPLSGIPKVFHRIWFSPPSAPPRPMPRTYQRYWQTWRRWHEPNGWKFVTWTAANIGRSGCVTGSLCALLSACFDACNMYTSAMLRNEQFNGQGRVASDSSSLATDDGLRGSIPVINAVDVRRKLPQKEERA
jgi:hypothetical protein